MYYGANNLMVRPIIIDGGTAPVGPHGGGTGGGVKPTSGPPTGAVNLSNLTSTGGMFGGIGLLLVPVLLSSNGRNVLALYDATDFNCEEDSQYYFKVEDVKPGRAIDVHKVYLQYRDIGKVKFTVSVRVWQFNKTTNKTKLVQKSVTVTVGGLNDNVIYDRFIDLKVIGMRPQLSILRKGSDGPICLITAMMIGNVAEEDQL